MRGGCPAREASRIVFLSSIAGKLSGPGFGVYSATKFGIRALSLALREELRDTGVGVSVVSPTFVRESGMWADTGMKANPLAGEVALARVAEAVWSAITRNRAEVDVMPLRLKAGLAVQALAPSLFTRIVRAAGAAQAADEVSERQRNKR